MDFRNVFADGVIGKKGKFVFLFFLFFGVFFFILFIL